jgi:ribosomal protein S15P/S13E
MKQYDVEVLKAMIENMNTNIKMFSKYPGSEETLYGMVKQRRNLAALVENDGVLDDNMVPPNSMSYSATAGADTSWWG